VAAARAPVPGVARVAAPQKIPTNSMNTLATMSVRWRSSISSWRTQKMSALAPKVARMPPASARMYVGASR